MDSSKSPAAALAVAAGSAVVGLVGGYLISTYFENKRRQSLDVVEYYSSGGMAGESENDGGAAGHEGNSSASSAGTASGPHTPLLMPVRKAVGRAASAYPAGGAVVSGDMADPESRRRKLSTEKRKAAPVIVGVAGASGSGKTSIAELIAGRLEGPRVVSISSDSYYKTLPPGTDSAHYNFDHPQSIDFDLLAEHLEKLRNGIDVEVPHYDFKTHRRVPEKTTHVSGRHTAVVIVDGIFVLWHQGVRSQCDLTIFCTEDMDVCLARRLRRDIVERGRTVESVLTQYLKFVKAGFQQFVAPTMTTADLIIPRARENVTAIDMLARDIQRRVDQEL